MLRRINEDYIVNVLKNHDQLILSCQVELINIFKSKDEIESTIECAIIRFQVDSNDKESLQQEDYDKYTRLLDRRDEVRAELKKREQ